MNIGAVVIGRNEGERIRRCLRSCEALGEQRVYVDSGSTDGSVQIAEAAGAAVVRLDMIRPFTAARARNAGARELLQRFPTVKYIQFVDGDCEVLPNWLVTASGFLDAHSEVVAVAGRRRERHPEASIYNTLCDIEWDTPVGEAKAVGGDALFRVDAFEACDGYRESLIAGEEPELCVRLRAHGGRVHRLGVDMTLHDAAMSRFSQWWKRTMRSGYAFAEGASLHGASPERHFADETRRALLWGVWLPLSIAALTTWRPEFAALLLAYPAQWLRLGLRFSKARGVVPWTHSALLMLGRLPEAQGALKFYLGRLRGRGSRLIEYK